LICNLVFSFSFLDPIYKDNRIQYVNTTNITSINNQTNNGYLGSNIGGSATIISNSHADSVEESSIEPTLVTNDNSKPVAASGEFNDKLSEQKTAKSIFEVQSKISDESTSKSVHIFSRQTPESTLGIFIRQSTEPTPTVYSGKFIGTTSDGQKYNSTNVFGYGHFSIFGVEYGIFEILLGYQYIKYAYLDLESESTAIYWSSFNDSGSLYLLGIGIVFWKKQE